METRRLKRAAGEQMPNVLIKEEMEWLAEDSYTPDLANPEVGLSVESMRSIKTEEDPYRIDDEPDAVQEFIPAPQTDECIKAKLMSASEGTCKPHVRALAAGHQPEVCKSDREAAGSSHTPKRNLNIQMHSKAQSINSFESEFSSWTVKAKSDLEKLFSAHAKEFPCDFCERSFSNKGSLSSHKKVHFKEAHLKNQMVRKHLNKTQSPTPGPQTAGDSKNTHTGELLDEKADRYGQASQESVTQDSESKSEVKIAACDVCHSNDPTEIIRTHMRLAHSKYESMKYQCKICSRPLKSKQTLEKHLSTHTTDRKREFACDICERTFYEKKTLVRHMKRYVQKAHPKFDCEVCWSSFTRKLDLDVHLRTQHLNKSQPIASAPQTADHNSREQRLTPEPSNGTGVSMKTELMSDEEFVVEGNDREAGKSLEPTDDEQRARVGIAGDSVTCKVCYNSYPGDLIETHMRITHGDGTYKCQFCARQFLHKKELERHIRTHDDKRPRPYACEQCGLKFTTQRALKPHMATQHTTNRLPEFNCGFCEKKFYTKVGMKLHVRTHAGVTYSCEVCGARFKRVQSLKSHMLRKHAAKTRPFTPDAQTANDDSLELKEELMSDEEFLDEET